VDLLLALLTEPERQMPAVWGPRRITLSGTLGRAAAATVSAQHQASTPCSGSVVPNATMDTVRPPMVKVRAASGLRRRILALITVPATAVLVQRVDPPVVHGEQMSAVIAQVGDVCEPLAGRQASGAKCAGGDFRS
jgi:hypothetical protein